MSTNTYARIGKLLVKLETGKTCVAEYETALFLCAVQHLQYEKTHQYAYVSDFQGYGGMLSDPQIMTSPELLKLIYGDEVDGDEAASRLRKNTLFGDGNVEVGFKKFALKHQCNHFCTWMDLAPFDVTDSLDE
ncbi:kinase-like protein [Dendrothele bispora CBS 962.96]|uniref:Kinase-like protein n=1 Tax=Dendrothele bispora (strain CBS 962.96) TaxID=1314807 RepID=A0A4S8LX75_DENBC|nr:kinase-like protein [Dendrothele bispora CBS 962.96]